MASFHSRPSTIPPPPPTLQYAYPGTSDILSSCYPHPISSEQFLPRLPTPQREPIWVNDGRIPYILTTHIIPAAYWREDPDVKLPRTPSVDERLSKEERKQLTQLGEERFRKLRTEADEEIACLSGKIGPRGQTKIMWICLNRYVRTSPVEGGNTLFFAHANGFPKETWEPTLLSFLSSSQTQSQVREIWTWDAANHGDSALLNEGKLDALFTGRNAVRDFLTFLLYYIPDPSHPIVERLPTHLPRLPVKETARRLQQGFSNGIIGVGHSFGGTVCTVSAMCAPSLFQSLILIDPVICYPDIKFPQRRNVLVLGALARQSVWKDRDTARQDFLRSPFFQAFDSKVLDLYVERGLYDAQREGDDSAGTVVRLKMPPVQEANVFINAPSGSAEAWVRLWRGELPEKVALRWIVPGESPNVLMDFMSTSDGVTPTQARVWLRPSNSSNVRMNGAGHLIPQERPVELGIELQQTLRSLGDGIQRSVAKL
ncbi:hypothetical protein D9758_010022 [Tetrapyrgos nigripes]|uniref:AB hydrolase-1 domain-containing protein n=1 Tax=Tetrapyrgos nigripes TaxID=182062 RepID=A0A8H5FSJ2_9AGAR|nr:hypothetical protein D9758_010022 [Tetrapyrgos nigripes]